jgi:quercetin dioxygenase-like cupin family protein
MADKPYIFSPFGAEPITPPRAEWTGTRTWWFANDSLTQSQFGALCLTEFDPGSAHDMHIHPNAEQITIVLSGEGQQLGRGDRLPQKPGDAAFIPKDEPHGFANSSNSKVWLLAAFGGVINAPDAGFEPLYGREPISGENQQTFVNVLTDKDLSNQLNLQTASQHFRLKKSTVKAGSSTLIRTADNEESAILPLTADVTWLDRTVPVFGGIWLGPNQEVAVVASRDSDLLTLRFW